MKIVAVDERDVTNEMPLPTFRLMAWNNVSDPREAPRSTAYHVESDGVAEVIDYVRRELLPRFERVEILALFDYNNRESERTSLLLDVLEK